MGSTDTSCFPISHMVEENSTASFINQRRLLYQQNNLSAKFRPISGNCMFQRVPVSPQRNHGAGKLRTLLSTNLFASRRCLQEVSNTRTNRPMEICQKEPINQPQTNRHGYRTSGISLNSQFKSKPNNSHTKHSSQFTILFDAATRTRNGQFNSECENFSRRPLQNDSIRDSSIKLDQTNLKHTCYTNSVREPGSHYLNSGVACAHSMRNTYQPHFVPGQNRSWSLSDQTKTFKESTHMKGAPKGGDFSNTIVAEHTGRRQDRYSHIPQNILPEPGRSGILPTYSSIPVANISRKENASELVNSIRYAKNRTGGECEFSIKRTHQNEFLANGDQTSFDQNSRHVRCSPENFIETYYGEPITSVQKATKLCQNLTYITLQLAPHLKSLFERIQKEHGTMCISNTICQYILQKTTNNSDKYLFAQYARHKLSICKLLNRTTCNVCLYDIKQSGGCSQNPSHNRLPSAPSENVNTTEKPKTEMCPASSPPRSLFSKKIDADEDDHIETFLLKPPQTKKTTNISGESNAKPSTQMSLPLRLNSECIIIEDSDDEDTKGTDLNSASYQIKDNGKSRGAESLNQNVENRSLMSLVTSGEATFSTFVFDENNLELTTTEFSIEDWQEMMND